MNKFFCCAGEYLVKVAEKVFVIIIMCKCAIKKLCKFQHSLANPLIFSYIYARACNINYKLYKPLQYFCVQIIFKGLRPSLNH